MVHHNIRRFPRSLLQKNLKFFKKFHILPDGGGWAELEGGLTHSTLSESSQSTIPESSAPKVLESTIQNNSRNIRTNIPNRTESFSHKFCAFYTNFII